MLVALFRHLSELNFPHLRLVFWALIASGCWVALARPRFPLPAWAAVIVCSVAWLRVDQQREGRLLVEFTPAHGLTEADLLVPVVVCSAAAANGLGGLIRGRFPRHRKP